MTQIHFTCDVHYVIYKIVNELKKIAIKQENIRNVSGTNYGNF